MLSFTLPVTASPKLWVKALAVGLDSFILIVVNDDYTNDREGTKITPVANAVLHLAPPTWMEAKDVFEIAATGTRDVAHRTPTGQLELDLGTVNVTRLLVITSDPALRYSVQQDYDSHFAANVRKLLGQ